MAPDIAEEWELITSSAHANGSATARGLAVGAFKPRHDDRDVPEGQYEVYDGAEEQETDGEGQGNGHYHHHPHEPAQAALQGQQGWEGGGGEEAAGHEGAEGGSGAHGGGGRLYPQGLAAGDEDVFEDVLQLRLQVRRWWRKRVCAGGWARVRTPQQGQRCAGA